MPSKLIAPREVVVVTVVRFSRRSRRRGRCRRMRGGRRVNNGGLGGSRDRNGRNRVARRHVRAYDSFRDTYNLHVKVQHPTTRS